MKTILAVIKSLLKVSYNGVGSAACGGDTGAAGALREWGDTTIGEWQGG